MKKILHVVGGMDVGGTETMLMNLYRNIDREKYEFHFISYYGREGFYDKEIESLGGKIVPLSFSKRWGALGSILELKRVIKENKYDAVHTHTLFNCGIGVLAAMLAGAKVRVSHAHTVFEEKNSFVKKCYINLMRGLIKIFSTNYLSCSDKAGEFLFGKEILKNKKYSFIPNYVDYKKFTNINTREEMRKQLGIESDEILIGHVGRFMAAKNHKFIIQILKMMKDKGIKVKGVFVGDGNLRDEIERDLKLYSLTKDVIITGMVKDTENYIGAMDIFLLPSTYEGFGLVLLEAQGAGIPAIGSLEIQKETDMGLGLLKRYSLNESVEFWCERIIEFSNEKIKISKEKREKAFIDKGYHLKEILRKLGEVYEG